MYARTFHYNRNPVVIRVRQVSPMFQGGQQHDSQELLLLLIDCLCDSMTYTPTPPSSPVVSLMGGGGDGQDSLSVPPSPSPKSPCADIFSGPPPPSPTPDASD
jgi:hypothetical protein